MNSHQRRVAKPGRRELVLPAVWDADAVECCVKGLRPSDTRNAGDCGGYGVLAEGD
jgi:hypothetical protein